MLPISWGWELKFVHWKDFLESLQKLMQMGGKFGKAAAQVAGILNLAQRKDVIAEVFAGIPTTNHGESRIQHCVKYDLQGSCRLVTVQHKDVCFLMFAGTHDDTDQWLNANKGRRFHIKTIDGKTVFESTRVSDALESAQTRLTTIPDFSSGLLWKKLPIRYFDLLCEGLTVEAVERIKGLTAITSEEELLDVAMDVDGTGSVDLIYDTFDLLRGGQVNEAKARIDLHKGNVNPIGLVSSAQIESATSGDEVVMNTDVDPVLFDHFVRTATFQKWMVYLHPAQREFVKRDFNGPARLAGVSGSGKTSVLIHRAIRLSREYPGQRILVLTLNRALAKLIRDLASSVSGETAPKNLEVLSLWELCRDKLLKLEPHNKLIYWDKTEKTNQFAVSEHIDEIWEEYFQCKNNNDKANVLEPLRKTLLNREVYPSDYIRQEFDFVRSALGPLDRNGYLRLEREGRSIPLEERYRKCVIEGLASWEEKMINVGAVDYLGLATALYKHLDKLDPEYRCVLIDEMQDFGAVELTIVRALVSRDVNDIFLCGDLAQSVLTKYHKLPESGIDVNGRSHSILKNYRNSREILTAAFELFVQNKDLFSSAPNIEILNPEFANFSSSPPLLLKANHLTEELSFATGYLRSSMEDDGGGAQKFCIAVCGYSQSEVEILGERLGLDVLTGDTDVVAGHIFISDLEQTKGFEFDSMIILNCAAGVIPHPALPAEESYRDLCKLYVAMTRAKRELIVSHSGEPTQFLSRVAPLFTVADWTTYADPAELPTSDLGAKLSPARGTESLNSDAQTILFMRQAVGLSTTAQDKLSQLVTGTNRFKNRRQTEWKTFDQFFDRAKDSGTTRSYNGVSDSVWSEFQSLNEKLKVMPITSATKAEKRPLLTLKKPSDQGNRLKKSPAV